jgi:NAD(P)-dependent dehydrogenase (short-subunit alcohol dehydrogenase family)
MSNILITGGASGLGEAITRKAAHDKVNRVFFTYSRSTEKAQAITTEFPNATAIHCDFLQAESIAELVNKMSEINPDILVNNAYGGDAVKTYFHKIPLDDFSADFERNIIPTVAITQAVISCFRKKKSGKIITVLTSFLLNTPPIGTSVYIANKAYLAELVKIWATENAKYGITSNSISPAFMQTAFTAGTDERIIEQMRNEHPLKRLLMPEEVADTVWFLANASPQINGVDIVVNAGNNVK